MVTYSTTIDNDSTTACSNEQLPPYDCVTTHDLVAKFEHNQLLKLVSEKSQCLCECATCTFKRVTCTFKRTTWSLVTDLLMIWTLV